METIAMIKQHAQVRNEANVYKINSLATDIHFITKGTIQLFDGYMNLASDHEVNDIVGVQEFSEWITNKIKQKEEKEEEAKGNISKKGKDKDKDKAIKNKYYAIAKENTE